jgi:FKBP-type peptidyl-prolyl cis-trans isomerase (trigger factor)
VGEPFQRTGVLGKGELLGQIDDQVQGLSLGEEKTIEVNRKPAEPEPAPEAAEAPEAGEKGETAPEQKAETTEADETAEAETEAETPELPEVETLPLDEAEEEGPMTFKVKLNSIKVKHEPELNDEFAQSVTDVKTLDELYERIRENLKSQKLSKSKGELTEKIVKEAVSRSTVSMPPVMINAEIHSLEENMANRLKQQKLTLDQYLQFSGKDHEAFHEELRPQAEDRIKTVLVLREIAEKEGIKVDQAEFEQEIEKMVGEFTKDATEEEKESRGKVMRDYLGNEQMQGQLRDEIFSRKLTDRLIELATGVKQTEEAPVEFADVPENSARVTEAEAVLAEAVEAEAPTEAVEEPAAPKAKAAKTKAPKAKIEETTAPEAAAEEEQAPEAPEAEAGSEKEAD